MTQTASSRPSQAEIETIHAQLVRSRGGVDMNMDGGRAAYQQAVPVLFAEISWLRAQYASAHATLAEAVPVDADDAGEDLARLTKAVAALWTLQEQGLYAKPAMAKLKQQNDDLRDRIAALTEERDDLDNRLTGAEHALGDFKRTFDRIEDDRRVQVAGWERSQIEMAAKRHALEAELEQAYQDQRDIRMAFQRETATLDAAHKEHAQQALALIVQLHGILAEDAA